MSSRWDPRIWNFDIDKFLNPFVPPPPWPYVPYPVSRFFGHRKAQPQSPGHLVAIFWAFVGIFCGISIITVVSERIPSFKDAGAPLIVGSFGAAAVLEFYSIESPLAQPRNAILGQVISSLVGVAVSKLFALGPNYENVRWAGGALACASATALMGLTKTVHPPAGATALLAVVDDRVRGTGWFLVPIVLCGCGLMLATALLVNNLQRRFPLYWWTPEDLRKRRQVSVEGQPETSASADKSSLPSLREVEESNSRDVEAARSDVPEREVLLKPGGQVLVPDDVRLGLSPEEAKVLDNISRRL